MNIVDVTNLSINDIEVMRVSYNDSVLYQWSIDSIPVNPDFEFISASFKSSRVMAGKIATLNMSVLKNFNPSGVVLIDDRGIIRREFKSFSVSTNQTDRDNVSVLFSPSKSEKGERIYTAYVLDCDGKRAANSVTCSLTVS